MENPVNAAKSAFNISNLVKFTAGFFFMNVVLDLLGVSEWFYSPVAKFRERFGKS